MKLMTMDDDGNIISIPDPENVPAFLASKRKELGLSLTAVAKVVGVTRQAVWGWENYKSMPSNERLVDLVKFFGAQDYEDHEDKDHNGNTADLLEQVEEIFGA